MLNREQKAKVVEALSERFRRSGFSIFTGLHAVPVVKLSQFRRELKKVGAEFKVAKKTLLNRALQAVGIGIEPKELVGEIGVIFGYEDPLAPAKTAAKFAKENETFRVLKGILGGRIMGASEVLAIAKLPPREELLAELLRVLTAPVRGLLNGLQGNIRNVVVVLNQIKGKK